MRHDRRSRKLAALVLATAVVVPLAGCGDSK
jgi:uncharacterized lipoprotein YehR (DUF1307 family)